MTLSRIAPLGLLLLAPLAHAGSTPTDPDAAVPELKLEYHPLRAGSVPKAAGESLKPDLGKPDYLPIDVALRMHVHEDGSTSFTCNEDHRPADAVAKPERRP